MTLAIVIMAAGKGTRMKSRVPKVLHRLAGRPLLEHVMKTALSLQANCTVVVTGYGGGAVQTLVGSVDPAARCVHQAEQLGTGHDVQQAVPALPDSGTTLILNGDVPLIRSQTLQALIQAGNGNRLALLTIDLPDPSGYGRILRNPDGSVQAIIEHKDASPSQRAITEVYTGIMAAPTAWLKRAVMGLASDNAQGEYYLTDVVSLAVAQGLGVVATSAPGPLEVLGVNDPVQLADLERRHQLGVANELLQSGVRLTDPSRLDVRGRLVCHSDVEIDINCVFEGDVELGRGVRVGSHCVIRDAVIGSDTIIHPFSHIDGSGNPVVIGSDSQVGPYARLRPGTRLGSGVHIGNFVEVKNSVLGDGTKANHLAYLGDSAVGRRVNFGAGSITANYDGAQKHPTAIGDDVHVGSNCVLVAPVAVGDGATIAAGSTVSKNAPAGQLTVARARQASVPGWKRPGKPRKSP